MLRQPGLIQDECLNTDVDYLLFGNLFGIISEVFDHRNHRVFFKSRFPFSPRLKLDLVRGFGVTAFRRNALEMYLMVAI